MNRNSITDLSARAMHHAVRMGLGGGMKINDNPMMQELDFGGLAQEGRKFVERVQGYGMSSVPLPAIVKKAVAAAGGGGGGGKSAKSGPEVEAFADGGGGGGDGGGGGEGGGQAQEAEGIAIFMAGQRNHPVVIGVDDRRHRPMGLKPGENAQYDDAQQMTLMRRNGLYLLSNDNEDGEGKKADRMVSLRHVEKGKQERKPQVQNKTSAQLSLMSARERRVYAQALAQQAKDDQAKQDFKHEGDTVNTEMRMTKKKIEFYNGNQQVGEHDKQSQKWNMKGKEFNATPSDGTNINTKQVNITGSTGIALTGSTSVNGSPVTTSLSLGPLFALVDSLQARVAALEARLAP